MTVRWGFGRQVVFCRKWLHCIGGERAPPLCLLYTLASAYPRLLLISALVLSTLAMQCRSKGTRVQEMVTWWPSTGLQVSFWYFSVLCTVSFVHKSAQDIACSALQCWQTYKQA